MGVLVGGRRGFGFFWSMGWGELDLGGKEGKMARGVRGFLEMGEKEDISIKAMEEIVVFAEENPGAVLYAPEAVWDALLREAIVMAKGGHPLALRFFRALEGIAFRAVPGGSLWEVLEA